jgi:hypothetical protein
MCLYWLLLNPYLFAICDLITSEVGILSLHNQRNCHCIVTVNCPVLSGGMGVNFSGISEAMVTFSVFIGISVHDSTD